MGNTFTMYKITFKNMLEFENNRSQWNVGFCIVAQFLTLPKMNNEKR